MSVTYKVDSSLDDIKLIKKTLKTLRNQQLDYGWINRHKRYSTKDRTRKSTNEKGKTQGFYVAQLAFWNEYGTTRKGFGGVTINQPPRPYMTQSIKIFKKQSPLLIAKVFETALHGANYKSEIDALGKLATSTVHQSVAMQLPPKLSKETERKKGFDYQWVETGFMMDHIEYKLVRTERTKK